MSFFRVEKQECDGVRSFSEVVFQVSNEGKSLAVKFKYNEHAIYLNELVGLEAQMRTMNMLEKCQLVLNVIDNSTICSSFSCQMDPDTSLAGVCICPKYQTSRIPKTGRWCSFQINARSFVTKLGAVHSAR